MVTISKKIHAAVVGIGFIGRQHIEAISRIPNTEVVAICHSNLEKAERLANEYGIEKYYEDLDELLSLSDLDVVHICTPNFLHYDMAKKVILAKKDVFCEKPLSLTSKESSELASLAKKHGVRAGVNHNYRANAMVREMKHRVEGKDLGNVLLAQGQYIQDWLMFDTDYDWHFDPKLVGPSRTVADIGTHLFDLIQFVLGEKIVSVFAELMTVYPQRKKREALGETFNQTYGEEVELVNVLNEDAAFILVKMESGTRVSLDLSQVSGGYKNGLELMISGSEYAMRWKQEEADRLWIGKRDGGNEELYADQKYIDKHLSRFISLPNGHAPGWADAIKNSIHEFYLDIRNNGHNDNKSYVDFSDGDYLMRLVEACLESNEEKRWVDVDA